MYVYQFIDQPLLEKSQKLFLAKYNIYVEDCYRADGKKVTYIINYCSDVDYNNEFVNGLLEQCIEVDTVVDEATYQKSEIMPYDILKSDGSYPLIDLFGFGPFDEKVIMQNSVCLLRGDGRMPESFEIWGVSNISQCEYIYDALSKYLTALQRLPEVKKVRNLCVDHSISLDDNIKMIKERYGLK